MSHQSELISTDIEAYLAQHERKELLRFMTCGSVDDGKSTLIGRLLYDANLLYDDKLKAIEKDSVKHGTTGGKLDFALATDGLMDERQQGITIDVAYLYFSTAKRKYIIADTPGHEQYTRNMATGASTCDLAIILIDARQGVLAQTKRHSFIVSLLGIKHIIVAVNKMDLVDFSEERFEEIKADYTGFAARLDLPDVQFIPVSALLGDNIVHASANMPWYQGGPLMNHLETVHIASDRNLIDFRYPVQYVNRPNLNFRGFCGTIASGIIRQGSEIMALPSRKTSRVKAIVTHEGDIDEAFAPLSVTLTLEDEIDVSRGDMLVHPGNVPRVDQTFDAMMVWMGEEPLVPGKPYTIKHTTKLATGSVTTLRYRVDVNTLHRSAAPTLNLNEIGRCQVTLNQPICFDAYKRNRTTGAFIIIDRLTNRTVGAGMILDQEPGDTKDYWEATPRTITQEEVHGAVSDADRQARFGQTPVTILLTGLTGSGKTTIAQAVERRLFDEGRAVTLLDGHNLRLGISRDLGFTVADRSENLRRAAEVARLMNQAGLIAICAFVAPLEETRQKARHTIGGERFIEVYLSAPIEVCRERDTDGMYPRADAGELQSFPGVSAPFEPPTSPDLTLATDEMAVGECVERIVKLLRERRVIG
ncbi:MAG: bifunctional sulfate adenylyltransferase subunit 1/adenylylsulfate kinase [Planctomycetota bacterium]|nr:MAG: bifunctional sulfate adenylyltransferase subunit 1/adenylylsulfate kinase [Planctomycetota bacterium]